MSDPAPESSQRRVLALLAAIAITVALVGVVTGISPGEYEAQRPEPRVAADPGDIPPARTHAELERRPWGSGPVASGWTESLGIADAVEVAREARAANGEAEPSVAEALEERRGRRAFDGAPPVVPHPVRPGGAAECVACHVQSFALAGRRASGIPHATFASCTQCHVSSAPSLAPGTGGPQAVPSGWTGLESATEGVRAYTGAPPAVSHATWMRERCDSCHGPKGRAALRTPHPERQSCLQCHPAISEYSSRGAR
jgi:cytochrome c-type protein NapB